MEEVEKRIEAILARREMQEKMICRITRMQGKHLKLIVCQGRKSRKKSSQDFDLKIYNVRLLTLYKQENRNIYNPNINEL